MLSFHRCFMVCCNMKKMNSGFESESAAQHVNRKGMGGAMDLVSADSKVLVVGIGDGRSGFFGAGIFLGLPKSLGILRRQLGDRPKWSLIFPSFRMPLVSNVQ